jgi:hypothetical protein
MKRKSNPLDSLTVNLSEDCIYYKVHTDDPDAMVKMLRYYARWAP